MKLRALPSLLLSLALLTPNLASADLVSIWAAGKGSYINGTGDVFENLDSRFGGGVEAGIEVLNLELMGEAFILGSDQYMFTGNLGMDFSVSLGLRLTVGGYLSIIAFKMPEPGSESLNIEPDLRAALEASSPGLVADIEKSYNDEYSDQAGELSQWAVGIGPRLRVQLDKSIAPTIYVGLEGSFGYHYMLSGDDIVAEAKSQAINKAIKDNGLDETLANELKKATGAESLDEKDLNGTNYNIGIYLKIDI